jgi:hypothetical protein
LLFSQDWEKGLSAVGILYCPEGILGRGVQEAAARCYCTRA